MNTPDIDIERLREAVEEAAWLPEKMVEGVEQPRPSTFVAVGEKAHTIKAALDFLVSLADQDGELWMETKCKHNLLNAHDYLWGVVGRVDCSGGSRVRVWPKETE